ncbi:hypothetical protein GCM10025787_03060 [Saccharopolyspora rosea]
MCGCGIVSECRHNTPCGPVSPSASRAAHTSAPAFPVDAILRPPERPDLVALISDGLTTGPDFHLTLPDARLRLSPCSHPESSVDVVRPDVGDRHTGGSGPFPRQEE